MSKVLNSGALDGLTVRIEAYLGGTESTVGELEALKPGETVELDTPLNQNVELRLNGVAVARGELVAVGDKFGVRLSDLLPGEKSD